MWSPIQGRKGQTLTLVQLRAFCASHPCTNGLGSALDGETACVHQLAIGADLSEQLFQDTDVGLARTTSTIRIRPRSDSCRSRGLARAPPRALASRRCCTG